MNNSIESLVNWMQKLDIGRNKLTQLVLPGSYCSGAYLPKQHYLGLPDWNCHQSKDIRTQLRLGARYLHLCVDKTSLGEYHCNGVYFPDLIREVFTFCRENPSEIILVEIETREPVMPILTPIIERFKNMLIPPRSLDDTLDQLRGNGKQVAVFSPRIDNHLREYICPSYFIHPSLIGADSVTFLNEACAEKGIFCNLRWLLPFSYWRYLTGWIFCRDSRVHNAELSSFLQAHQSLVLKKAKIISLEWFEDHELITKIVLLNSKLIRPYYGSISYTALIGTGAL